MARNHEIGEAVNRIMVTRSQAIERGIQYVVYNGHTQHAFNLMHPQPETPLSAPAAETLAETEPEANEYVAPELPLKQPEVGQADSMSANDADVIDLESVRALVDDSIDNFEQAA